MTTKRTLNHLHSVTKKQKMCDVIFDSETINKVLPKYSLQDLEKCLLVHGPKEWKKATDSLSLVDAKKFVYLIIKQTSLVEPFAVYVSLYETGDAKPATHLYELGLGHMIKQHMLPETPENKYLKAMLGNVCMFDVEPILPELKSKHQYACLNKNFIRNDNFHSISQRIEAENIPKKDLFFKKLTSAVTCATLKRWSECFAHSLSALDIYQPTFLYLHDLYCLIVLSASQMAVSLHWCCKILIEALYCESSIEHMWRRINVFQVLLTKQGLFDLESEVYTTIKQSFAKCSLFYSPFLSQHLTCLLMQVEDNLAFQYVRQRFHSNCTELCNKDPCLKESFASTLRLLGQIDKLAQKLKAPGQKEYFQAYFHLYNTMLTVGRFAPKKRDSLHLEIAERFFALARMRLTGSDVFYKDADMMTKFILKKKLNFVIFHDHFTRGTNMRFSDGLSNFLFRAMLVTMYWQDTFQPIALEVLTKNAKEFYSRMTNDFGYRMELLKACVKILDGAHRHQNENILQDFPILKPSQERLKMMYEAQTYWNFETTKFKIGFDLSVGQRPVPSAKSLLEKSALAEQVYAFGYQISESITFN